MRKILVLSNSIGVAGRNSLAGIFAHAATRRDWSILPILNPEDFEPDALRTIVSGSFAGIITNLRAISPDMRRFLATETPLVMIHNPPKDPLPKRHGIVIIRNDNPDIGRLAATHFLSKGHFAAYAFVPTPNRTPWSVYRERGFRTELNRHGIVARTWHSRRESLAAFLKALPKPAAILGATDGAAMDILSECRRLKISVPSKVSVIGVDDDEIFCESTQPTLTSVRTDDLAIGKTAAAALEKLMNARGKSPVETIEIPPNGITERASTRTIPPAGRLIQAALAFIRQNVAAGIDVRDVARHLNVSESLVRTRFREIHGKSVRDVILEMRLELAKKKLLTTTAPLSQVASASGFSSACRLSHFFKERLGVSPEDYRAQGSKRRKGRLANRHG